MSQQCQVGSENPNPLHFNTVSYPLTYRLFVSGHSINTGARLLPPSSSAVPPDLLPLDLSIPLDLKVFTSHHEARNSSVTLLVCFKPQWEPCARVLWDWSPPWKKLFLIPVKQHGMACASSARCPFVFIIYVKKDGVAMLYNHAMAQSEVWQKYISCITRAVALYVDALTTRL